MAGQLGHLRAIGTLFLRKKQETRGGPRREGGPIAGRVKGFKQGKRRKKNGGKGGKENERFRGSGAGLMCE